MVFVGFIGFAGVFFLPEHCNEFWVVCIVVYAKFVETKEENCGRAGRECKVVMCGFDMWCV